MTLLDFELKFPLPNLPARDRLNSDLSRDCLFPIGKSRVQPPNWLSILIPKILSL